MSETLYTVTGTSPEDLRMLFEQEDVKQGVLDVREQLEHAGQLCLYKHSLLHPKLVLREVTFGGITDIQYGFQPPDPGEEEKIDTFRGCFDYPLDYPVLVGSSETPTALSEPIQPEQTQYYLSMAVARIGHVLRASIRETIGANNVLGSCYQRQVDCGITINVARLDQPALKP